MTEKLSWIDENGEPYNVRDNYHTILLAKNMDGVRELNELVSLSNRDDHFYYKPRISFDEFLRISPNIIKTSACLASPLNKLPITHPMYERLVTHYDYLEIQPHNHPDQIAYNVHLAELSQKYGIPLVAGTDTHSLDQYKAECRTILQLAKHIEFADEDTFDLTYKSYDELVEMFRVQGALPEKMYLEAIGNTNRIADSVEDFELDTAIKYPFLYGERDEEVFMRVIEDGFKEKVASGAITAEQIPAFEDAIKEECRVFKKTNMIGFLLFMSEFVRWCKSNSIPVGFCRGSVGGSRVAYITDIIDLNPETWHTVFSRFANESRIEVGDIDLDFAPSDRDRAYSYIINRFGTEKTAYILAIGTVKARGVIDEVVRALNLRWLRNHQSCDKPGKEERERLEAENPFSLKYADQIKIEVGRIDEAAKEIDKPGTQKYREYFLSCDAYKKLVTTYPEVFRYFEGLLDVAISQSMHPAGIVASPITLRDNYGTLISDGKEIVQIDMDCVHDAGLVKYDIWAIFIRKTHKPLSCCGG